MCLATMRRGRDKNIKRAKKPRGLHASRGERRAERAEHGMARVRTGLDYPSEQRTAEAGWNRRVGIE